MLFILPLVTFTSCFSYFLHDEILKPKDKTFGMKNADIIDQDLGKHYRTAKVWIQRNVALPHVCDS